MGEFIRGVESQHEQRQQELLRDTRTLGRKFGDALRNPQSASVMVLVSGLTGIYFPAVADLGLLLGIFVFFMSYLNKTTLPFRMPQRSKLPDYNDIMAGTTKARLARGITFIGNDRKTNEELWFTNDDMRTHMLIFGSTGSGKTVALVSIAFNALTQGSGFIYVDGKGDNSLFANIYSMCRSMGREDDLLLINFMTGARDVLGAQKNRLSNTMNPFANGSSDMLSQLVVSLMGSSSESSDGDMWKGRAISFVEALMRVLTYMRDQGHILLDAHIIRKYFVLPKLEFIAIDKKFPIDDRFVDMSDAPEVVLDPLNNFLQTLPGFDPNKKGRQSGECLEQHGFIVMQLTRTFNSLADTYGHIIRTKLAEVDFRDVILNRRVLVVLLPALEKSPAELSNLGKLIVASLKAMMASGLGEQVEGTYREVIERKATNAPTPYMCILDEYGYYAVDGFAVVPAQARSLGFSAIFAGQDLPAFQKASKEEAASIGANTNIKICMKLEDPTDTLEFFVKTAGEAYVTTTSGFQTKTTNVSNSYLDTQGAQVEKRSRIELLDLKDQREGEMHIFFKSKIVRGRSFYANPPKPPRLQLNQFLKVDIPVDEALIDLVNRIETFKKTLEAPEAVLTKLKLQEDEELQLIIQSFANSTSDHLLNNAAQLLVKARQQHIQVTEAFADQSIANEKILESGMDIFQKRAMDFMSDPLKLLEIDPFMISPILDRGLLLKNMSQLENICGVPKKESQEITLRQIDEISNATFYPPENRNHADKSTVLESIQRVIEAIENLKNPPPAAPPATE
jgi:intracellular multiplication protein IcmO